MADVEILGGPRGLNKGDTLMLHAVVDRLCGSHRLAVATGKPNLPRLRRVVWKPVMKEYGRAVRAGRPRQLGTLAKRGIGLSLLPGRVLESRGYLRGERLDGLVDISGYAYADQWPVERTRRRAEYFSRLKQMGARLVMLPQALGPFEDPETAMASADALRCFDLIYARDAISKRHVEALGLEGTEVRLAPDITHLVKPPSPADSRSWRRRVCIVPNIRMLDMTSADTRGRYRSFLFHCTQRVRSLGFEPILLLHERNDRSLAAAIASEVDFDLPVFDEDAEATKALIGASHAVIASRYHGIIGALSQGVPTLGTSWSHKYETLFEEYDCPEMLVSPAADADVLNQRLDALLETGENRSRRERLEPLARQAEERVARMWSEVGRVLNGGR